jgi:hypothetical protein
MFAEDLNLFVADFGDPATLAGVEVRGIFDGPHARGDVGMLSMADARPMFTLLTADIPAPVLRWFDPEFDAETPLPDIGPDAVDLRLVVRGLADSVSTDTIDSIYQAGRDAGAVGGKLLGAGGGGFVLFYVEPERQQAVREALKPLVEVRFGVDYAGSKIVVYEPNGLESR